MRRLKRFDLECEIPRDARAIVFAKVTAKLCDATSRDAEDLQQEILLRLWQMRDRIAPNDIKHWCAIASLVTDGKVTDYHRANGRRGRAQHQADGNPLLERIVDEHDDFAGVDVGDEVRIIREYVARSDELDRAILDAVAEGKSLRKLAVERETPPAHVYQRWDRIREGMRVALRRSN